MSGRIKAPDGQRFGTRSPRLPPGPCDEYDDPDLQAAIEFWTPLAAPENEYLRRLTAEAQRRREAAPASAP